MLAVSSVSPVCCVVRAIVVLSFCRMLQRGTATDGEERQKVFEVQVLGKSQHEEDK